MFSVCLQRDVVEKAFRTTKGRYHWPRYGTRDRTDACTTVVYMPWQFWGIVEGMMREKFPGMTPENALKSLSNIALVKFSLGKSIHGWMTRPTDEREKLLNLFGATMHLLQP